MQLWLEIIKWVILVGIIVYLFFTCLNIVPQESAYVVERLGKYHTTWNAGIHLRIPFVDQQLLNGGNLHEGNLHS